MRWGLSDGHDGGRARWLLGLLGLCLGASACTSEATDRQAALGESEESGDSTHGSRVELSVGVREDDGDGPRSFVPDSEIRMIPSDAIAARAANTFRTAVSLEAAPTSTDLVLARGSQVDSDAVMDVVVILADHPFEWGRVAHAATESDRSLAFRTVAHLSGVTKRPSVQRSLLWVAPLCAAIG